MFWLCHVVLCHVAMFLFFPGTCLLWISPFVTSASPPIKRLNFFCLLNWLNHSCRSLLLSVFGSYPYVPGYWRDRMTLTDLRIAVYSVCTALCLSYTERLSYWFLHGLTNSTCCYLLMKLAGPFVQCVPILLTAGKNPFFHHYVNRCIYLKTDNHQLTRGGLYCCFCSFSGLLLWLSH